jgi:hypothetical protein
LNEDILELIEKNFTPSEAIAIRKMLEEVERNIEHTSNRRLEIDEILRGMLK